MKPPRAADAKQTLIDAANDWEHLTLEQLDTLAKAPQRGPREPIVSYWLRTRAREGGDPNA